MKRGYKEAEIGEIPEEWDVKTLDEIGTTYTGLSGKSKSDFGSGFPFVPFMNINRNSHVDDTFFDYVRIDDNENQNTVQYGDILFTTSSETPDEVGMSSVVLCKIQKLYLNSFSFGYRPNKNSNLLPEYAEYVFRGKKSRQQIEFLGQGSTRYNISKNQLVKMYIPLPPLPEQKKIADVLSSVDESIRATQAVIEQAKVLKQGMLNQLLTKGIGHKKFKQTEIGEIPFEWEVKEINQCTTYVDYRGKTPDKTDNGVFLVTAKNIREGFIDYQSSKEYVSENDYTEVMRRGLPQIRDVLITTEAPLGKVAQIDREDIALAQRVIKYRGLPEILSNDYLKYYFLSDTFQKILFEHATGTTAQGIKGSVLHTLPVLVPTLAEQKQIAQIASQIDEMIYKNYLQCEQLLIIKSGLMQDLLSGKKRVI